MLHPEEENARFKRERTREAIALAMESRWEEAVAANQTLLEGFPTDVDAHNRLGRALMELGRFAEAKAAYTKALQLEPNNTIAKKNLSRLAELKAPAKAAGKTAAKTPKGEAGKVVLESFIGEEGKAGMVSLIQLAPKPTIARLAVGDQVVLKVKKQNLVVETASGDYLGTVESQHGLRLARLMQGGNKYSAALASLDSGSVKVFIRETLRSPKQSGRPSFPRMAEGIRPYLRDTILKYELGEEAEEAEEVEGEKEEEVEVPVDGTFLEESPPIAEEAVQEEEEEE